MLIGQGRHRLFKSTQNLGLGVVRHYSKASGYRFTSVVVNERKIWRSDQGTATALGDKGWQHLVLPGEDIEETPMPPWLQVLLFYRVLKYVVPASLAAFFVYDFSVPGILLPLLFGGLGVAWFTSATRYV